jgi:hypothetical protein
MERMRQTATVMFGPALKSATDTLEVISKWGVSFVNTHDTLASIAGYIGGIGMLGIGLRATGGMFNWLGLTGVGGALQKIPGIFTLIRSGFTWLLGAIGVTGAAVLEWVVLPLTVGLGVYFGTKWLAEKMGIEDAAARIMGLDAAMEKMNKPLTEKSDNPSRLAFLTGDHAQDLRREALAHWEAKAAPLREEKRTTREDWWKNQGKQGELNQDEASIRYLHQQIERAASGKAVIGSSENEIASGERNLGMMEKADKTGMGSGDMSAQEVHSYVVGLREQLVQARAEAAGNTTNSATHNTTININANGPVGEQHALVIKKHVTEALNERDRQAARTMRMQGMDGHR